MRWSDDRILTTHVGSLPRGEPLTSLLLAEEKDEMVDRVELSEAMRSAVETVAYRTSEAPAESGPS